MMSSSPTCFWSRKRKEWGGRGRCGSLPGLQSQLSALPVRGRQREALTCHTKTSSVCDMTLEVGFSSCSSSSPKSATDQASLTSARLGSAQSICLDFGGATQGKGRPNVRKRRDVQTADRCVLMKRTPLQKMTARANSHQRPSLPGVKAPPTLQPAF